MAQTMTHTYAGTSNTSGNTGNTHTTHKPEESNRRFGWIQRPLLSPELEPSVPPLLHRTLSCRGELGRLWPRDFGSSAGLKSMNKDKSRLFERRHLFSVVHCCKHRTLFPAWICDLLFRHFNPPKAGFLFANWVLLLLTTATCVERLLAQSKPQYSGKKTIFHRTDTGPEYFARSERAVPSRSKQNWEIDGVLLSPWSRWTP